MFSNWAIRLAATVWVVAQMTAKAQDLDTRLVFFSEIPFQSNSSVVITNFDGKILDGTKWFAGVPYYRELILPLGTYTIQLNTPVSTFLVGTSEKSTTFFQVSEYSGENVERGIQVTIWQGKPNSAIKKTVAEVTSSNLKSYLEPIRLGRVGNGLVFNTEPPWSGPFGPKSPPPPPPTPSTPQK